MTTTYNVNIVGSLTNNNGILSGFSDSNYATCNRNFDPSANSWEIVFKIRRTSNTHTNSVFFAKVFDTWSGIRMQLISTNQCAILGMGDGRNSTTVLSLNTWYWVKLKYNNPTYTLYISTDGTYYTAEATDTLTTTYPSYNNPCTIGKQLDTSSRPWDGEVDLNESYIKVNDLIFWQGVSDTSNVITKIQLRHDTAANWTSVNPVLLEGEVGIETDTKKQKIGDGSTPWNNLAYDLGSTALQVSGGTMTGGLILEDIGATAVVQKYPNITYNTAPSSSGTYGGFAALDTDSNWMGIWGVERYTDNHTVIKMQGKSRTGTQGRLQLVSRTDGTWVAQAPTPLANSDTNEIATTEWARDITDGQLVAVDQLLTTSTATGSYNIDISSYLPNDSYDYEIILNGEIYNSNSTYGQVWLGSSKSTTIIVSNVGTNKRLSTILAPLVVSTNREITMQIAGHSIEWQNVNNRRGLYLVSYRRLGTNS